MHPPKYLTGGRYVDHEVVTSDDSGLASIASGGSGIEDEDTSILPSNYSNVAMIGIGTNQQLPGASQIGGGASSAASQCAGTQPPLLEMRIRR